jgi:hypothetical protein
LLTVGEAWAAPTLAIQGVTVDLVRLSFSVAGCDAQPDLTEIPGVTITRAPSTDQQSLQSSLEDDLDNVLSTTDYARGGKGRIAIV